MNKYIKVMSNAIQETSEYRFNHILSFLTIALPLIFIALLWETIYTDVPVIKGYSRNQMVLYYFLVILIQDIVYPVVNWEITEDIREGGLSLHIAKPMDYLLYNLSIKTGVNAPYLIVSLILIFPLFLVFRNSITIQVQWLSGLLFLFCFLLSFLLGFLLSYLFSILAFWLEESSGIELLINVLTPFLTGLVLPIALYPGIITKILNLLPFRYVLNFPVDLFLGRLETPEIISGFGYQLFWMVSIFFLVRFVWNRGIKNYAAYGG